jgi:thioredoxin type arsenate reductase
MSRSRRAVCEFIGTAVLLGAVVGSGIMGERLSGGNAALALLANSIATGAALLALILTFGPISGAHLNPVITLTAALQRRLSWRDVPVYLFAEIAGAFTGVACANGMFGLPLFLASSHARPGWAQLFSESLATFGLVIVVWTCVEFRAEAVPYAAAAYITAAYWFTASTSFANPAVTMARAATDTFAGIRPDDVSGFIVAQLGGAALAMPFLAGLRGQSGLTGAIDSGKGITKMKKRILFLCTGNSARSQMAEGLMRHLAGERYDVFSAGTSPKGLHALSVGVMNELGIDVSRQASKDLKVFLGQEFDYVITVCDRARQQCPVFPGAVPIHWQFDDPAEAVPEMQMTAFRQVRDEIMQRIRVFLSSNGG